MHIRYNTTGLRFSGSSGTYSYTPNGRRVQHSTDLFRLPNQILGVPELLQQFFPNGCPIYDYACSDGSEPYSIALTLLEKNVDAKKYPILARDISPHILQVANSGYVPLMPKNLEITYELLPSAKSKGDFTLVPEATPLNVKHYYDPQNRLEGYNLPHYDIGERLYRVSHRLKDLIKFELGDLGTDHLTTPGLFLFNNMFYHLSWSEQETILRNIPKGSLLLGKPSSSPSLGEPNVEDMSPWGFQKAFPNHPNKDEVDSPYSAWIKFRD